MIAQFDRTGRDHDGSRRSPLRCSRDSERNRLGFGSGDSFSESVPATASESVTVAVAATVAVAVAASAAVAASVAVAGAVSSQFGEKTEGMDQEPTPIRQRTYRDVSGSLAPLSRVLGLKLGAPFHAVFAWRNDLLGAMSQKWIVPPGNTLWRTASVHRGLFEEMTTIERELTDKGCGPTVATWLRRCV